jgi:uncharacterized protein (DUF1499 family)
MRGARLEHAFAEVWRAAVLLARSQPRWHVVETDPAAGRIVAESTSRMWKFVDDVVIDLSLDENGFTRVDVSSHSRKGRFDFGVNGRRIRSFLRKLERALPDR